MSHRAGYFGCLLIAVVSLIGCSRTDPIWTASFTGVAENLDGCSVPHPRITFSFGGVGWNQTTDGQGGVILTLMDNQNAGALVLYTPALQEPVYNDTYFFRTSNSDLRAWWVRIDDFSDVEPIDLPAKKTRRAVDQLIEAHHDPAVVAEMSNVFPLRADATFVFKSGLLSNVDVEAESTEAIPPYLSFYRDREASFLAGVESGRTEKDITKYRRAAQRERDFIDRVERENIDRPIRIRGTFRSYQTRPFDIEWF